jgi:hypothetical protein
MTTYKKSHKRKLSSLVKQQVPEYVLSDHPKFTEFLKAYYLFMESAELQLDTITAIDQVLLETETATISHLLFDQTDATGADKGSRVVQEENTFGSAFVKGETITGGTSGAISEVITEDLSNTRLFITANNGFITGETITGATSGATAKVAKYRANPVENIQQLLNYSDPDHTISDFLSQMKDEFLNTVPKNTTASLSTRKLIKNIKSLYRAKGTARGHKAFFRMLLNENAEIYTPTDDMLRVSDGNWSTDNFIRCTQTAAQSVNDPIYLIGQTITQADDPANDDVGLATAVVENVTKYQEGAVTIVEVAIHADTTTGTFVRGEVLSGDHNDDDETSIKMVIASVISTATITNDGSTLTTGDEATISGGAGAGARVQVGDLSGSGVDEVIVNAGGQNYAAGDTLTFSSGTASAKVAVVNGGLTPEAGSLSINVELETGTITGTGSGDLLLEDAIDSGAGGKFLDSTSSETDTHSQILQEDGAGVILSEANDGLLAERELLVYENSVKNIYNGLEATDHIVLEGQTTISDLYLGQKIVQEIGTASGDITDIRMIASGSGYTSLPTATISGDRQIELEDATDSNSDGAGRIELEKGGLLLSNETFPGTSATVIPFGDEIGRATSLNIVEHGINYTSAPTLAFPKYAVLKTVSGTISADETFSSNVSGATGTVVSYYAPLLKYTATTSELEVGDTITTSGSQTAIVSKADTLTGTTTIDTNISTSGKYIDQDGWISESSKKIQDSLYYQDYSYVIRVASSINKWRDSFKRAMHPSGFYVTGEVNIATLVSGQISSPVAGIISGASDAPIFSIVNTLFSTIFGRRTGVGLRSMSNGVELDGKTKRSSLLARTGVGVEPQDAYVAPYTASTKELNLHPETTLLLEKTRRANWDITARGTNVHYGYAYVGPSLQTLNTYRFTAYSPSDGIQLEKGTGSGKGELLLEDGNLLNTEEARSFGSLPWDDLRFIGTYNTSVDGETIRISDINGSTSNLKVKTNIAFPCEVIQYTT